MEQLFENKYIKQRTFIRCSTLKGFEDCIKILKKFIFIDEPNIIYQYSWYSHNTCLMIYKNSDNILTITVTSKNYLNDDDKNHLYSCRLFKNDFKKNENFIWS